MKTIFLSVLFALSVVFPAHALEIIVYKESLVAQEKVNEAVYALHFYAEWCSVCLGQKRAMQKLEADKDLKNLRVYLVDFDFEKKLKNEFNVERQSTIIIFRGQQEISRSLAINDKDKIAEFLKKGL